MIKYFVNNELVTSESLILTELIDQQVGSDEGVAVAIDGAVVPKSQWSRMIEHGARIDILIAVQGG